jgi:hypothetical protein
MKIGWLTAAAWVAACAVGADDRALRVEALSPPNVRDWSARIDRLLASRDLVIRQTRDDTMIAGRRHERLAQLHRGVPVFGGELAQQSDFSGALTVFGTFYEGIDLDVAPSLGPRDVERALAARGGQPFGDEGAPELVVLPREGGAYRLAYRVRAVFLESFDIRQSFYDARTGELLLDYRDVETQASGMAAKGTGVLGDEK